MILCPPSMAKKLKDACRASWIQHIDSYAVFLELLPALHTTFQAMVIPRQYEDFGLIGIGMVKL